MTAPVYTAEIDLDDEGRTITIVADTPEEIDQMLDDYFERGIEPDPQHTR